MIAVDTNVLVYAHRRDTPWHAAAAAALRELAEGASSWAIPWPCIHEFVAVVTHERIFAPPSTVAAAAAQVDAWLESPTLVLLGDTAGCWPVLRTLVENSRITGSRVHDARIAALCLHHGVRELLTADRDFTRFPRLRTRNPLIAA